MRKLLNNKIFRFIYGTIKSIFFLCLIVYVLFLVVQRFSNNSSIMGYRVFTIATGSMEPVYNVNDVIIVKETEYKSLKIGDDVTYLGNSSGLENMIITHRIVEKDEKEGSLVTKGVANDTKDPKIKSNQVFGKVVYKSIILSFFTNLVRNKVGFYFIIFVPLVLVIFLEIADFVVKDKDDEDEETSA